MVTPLQELYDILKEQIDICFIEEDFIPKNIAFEFVSSGNISIEDILNFKYRGYECSHVKDKTFKLVKCKMEEKESE